MRVTPKVKQILSWYEGESPGVKANIARLLMEGRLAGSGKLVILQAYALPDHPDEFDVQAPAAPPTRRCSASSAPIRGRSTSRPPCWWCLG